MHSEKSTHDSNKEPSQHNSDKHILATQLQLIHMIPTDGGQVSTHSYGTYQAPNALKYVDALKSQTMESHSLPGIRGTCTTPK